MNKIIIILLAVWANILLVSSNAATNEITVAGAANVQFTLEELKTAFTKATGIEVKTIIGSSGKLTSQIENSAPIDVFLSADMKYPSKIYKDGFSIQAPQVYAKGVLVLWTMKDLNLSRGIKVLTDDSVHQVAIANPTLAHMDARQ